MESNLFLQKNPKFAVSSSKLPITEYIAVTKRICDELGGKHHWGRIVQKFTKKPKKSYNTSRRRRGQPATSPSKRRRPSKPSGKTPLE